MRVEGVGRRVEQFAVDVAHDRFRDPREIRVAADLVRVAVRAQGHRLIVSELLEVRHSPIRVRRVAMESAAELIEYSTRRNFPQRVERDRGVLRMAIEAVCERQLDRGKIVEPGTGALLESTRLS